MQKRNRSEYFSAMVNYTVTALITSDKVEPPFFKLCRGNVETGVHEIYIVCAKYFKTE